jgi:uncharacterized CHY-type Zn-finger protein
MLGKFDINFHISTFRIKQLMITNKLQQTINDPNSQVIIDGENEIIVLCNDQVHYCEVITTSILSADTDENTNYFDHLLGVLVIQEHDSGDRASLEALQWYDRLEYAEYLDCQLCGEIKISFELGCSNENKWESPYDEIGPTRFCREVCLDLVTSMHCYPCNLMFDPYETKNITEEHYNFDDTYSVCTSCNNRLTAFDFKRYKEEKIAKQIRDESLSDHQEKICTSEGLWHSTAGEDFF